MSKPEISVVLPVYNEAEAVEEVVRDVIETLSTAGKSFEVLAINDGSQDCSEESLLKLQREYPQWLRVASHVHNKGNGAALRTGIRLAQGEIVVCMDSDGQHQASEMLSLLAKIPPYDMAVGARTREYAGKWYRNLGNRFYNWFASWLTQYPILDLTSGFRAMRREATLHFLPLFPAGFSSPTTLTMTFLKAGYSVAYVPIQVRPRTLGKSKINVLRDGRKFVLIILRMVMLYDPLRIFLPISNFLLFLGLAAMAAGVWAAGRLVVPGSSVVLFIAGVLAMLLGLVSSQISNATITYHGDEFVKLYEAPVSGANEER